MEAHSSSKDEPGPERPEHGVAQTGSAVAVSTVEEKAEIAPLAPEASVQEGVGVRAVSENSGASAVTEQGVGTEEKGLGSGGPGNVSLVSNGDGHNSAESVSSEKYPPAAVPAAAPQAPTSVAAAAPVGEVTAPPQTSYGENSAAAPAAVAAPGQVVPIEEKQKPKYYYKPKVKPKPQKLILPPTPKHYYEPNPLEKKATTALIGAWVLIFWDGEGKYYPAQIVNYNPTNGLFQAAYVGDPDGACYDEDLSITVWKIWKGPIKTAAPEPPSLLESTRGNPGRACKVQDYSDMFNDGPKEKREKSVVDPHKRKKDTYENMVAEAVYQIADARYGASLNNVRKYITNTFSTGNMHVASFNKKTIDGVNTAIANQRIEKTDVKSHTYRPTLEEKTRKRNEAEEQRRKAQEEMNRVRLGGGSKSGSSSSSSKAYSKDDYDLNIVGTAVENNRALRQALIDQRNRRDRHLKANMSVLKPFLPEKNYFFRKDAKEQKLAASRAGAQAQGGGEDGPPVSVKAEGVEGQEQEKKKDEVEVPPIDEASELNSALRDVKMLDIPEKLTATLHEHQSQGISWMVHMYRQGMPMILGDQMGLGKTIQTIGFFAYLKYSLNISGPFLVVVPLSVLSNWITEINRFCPTLRSVRFHGPKEERARIKSEEMKDLQDFDVVVTTYEVLVGEATWLRRRYMWTSIVVDEGHRLKNEKSQLSEKLRSMPCLSKVILSGTPLQNNLRELWALLHFLAPDVFNNATAQVFMEGFDVVKSVIDNRTLRLSRKLLGTFMLRRLKEHVAITLPSRRELTVLVPLTETQKLLYKHLLCGLDRGTLDMVMGDATAAAAAGAAGAGADGVDSELGLKKAASTTSLTTSSGGGGGGGGTTMNDTDWRKLMNLLLQLRKICNHTYLMPEMAPSPYEVTEDIVQGSGKLLMLDRLLPKLKADQHRVLIFSQFTSMLDLLEDFCELRGHPYARLDGETNRVQRRLDCRRFNASNSPLFIFLISTRAGGLGLNLATADTVILYDSDWNPQVDLQAMERAHRIGQVKPVRVFRLVCSGSIEERMISRAEKKLYLNAMVAEQSAEQIDEHGDLTNSEQAVEAEDVSQALGIGKSSLSKGELASLIRFGANAVVDSDAGSSAMSEEQVDRLLERQGRDKPYPGDEKKAPSSSSSSSGGEAEGDTSSALESELQGVLRARMEKLKEIDLRQLGDTYYASARDRKKGGGDAEGRGAGADSVVWVDDDADSDLDLMVDGKRSRKQRITMVAARGSGYGGDIPTLSSEWAQDGTPAAAAPALTASRGRSRDWAHQDFCCLCAKRRVREGDNMLRCVHCPKIFHEACLARFDWPKSPMGFICPHHKCQECGRGTAASGGLLFRCVDCLTSYCEDCLPDEEVESVGRCRALEGLGYHARQAYYIKCSPCCVDAGIEAKGVHGDALEEAEKAEKEKAEKEKEKEKEEKERKEAMQVEQPSEGAEGRDKALLSSAAATSNGSGAAATASSEGAEEGKEGAEGDGDKEGGGEEQEEEDEDEEEDFLLTQYMKVKWEEEVDSEDERDRVREEAKRKRAEKRAAAKQSRDRDKGKGGAKAQGKGKGKGKGKPAKKRARTSNSDEDEEDESEQEEEEEEEESEDDGGSKRKRKGRASRGGRRTRKKAEEHSDEEEEEEEEEEELAEVDVEEEGDPYSVDPYWASLGLGTSARLSLERALDVLSAHPSYQALAASPDFNAASDGFLAGMREKVLSERYRGGRAFVADARHWAEGLSSAKRGTGALLREQVQVFLETYVEGRV